MSNCCSNSRSKTATQACPQCNAAGKRVEMLTLYHQIRFPENQHIISDAYYFCQSKDCTTGYFSVDGNSIPKQHLRTHQAIQKDTLCYCFDIGERDYLTALSTNHAVAIKNFVMQRTKSGECACELRNPSGQCCLSKFKHLENEYRSTTAGTD